MSRIEKASHISVILLSVAGFICLIPALKTSLLPSQQSAAASKMLGQKLELPGAHWAPGGATVLIAMTSRCSFCVASLPFYRELSSIAAASGGRIALLVASTKPDVDELEKLLQDNGVQPAKIVPSSFRALHVSGTPSVYVVDASGTIKWAHVGQMDGAKQKELVQLLRTKRVS